MFNLALNVHQICYTLADSQYICDLMLGQLDMDVQDLPYTCLIEYINKLKMTLQEVHSNARNKLKLEAV